MSLIIDSTKFKIVDLGFDIDAGSMRSLYKTVEDLLAKLMRTRSLLSIRIRRLR